jgi:hypothetical protein
MLPLALELTLPVLIWNRKLRWVYICGSSVFHLSIAVFMGLVCFSIMMLVLLLGFIPGWVIRDLFPRSLRRAQPAHAGVELAPASERVSALTAAGK